MGGGIGGGSIGRGGIGGDDCSIIFSVSSELQAVIKSPVNHLLFLSKNKRFRLNLVFFLSKNERPLI